MKVSVIIPVYNTSQYLRECLDSLSNQTIKQIEFICVNDGSTDNCQSILNEYAKKDSRFIILNQENKGISAARNYALEHSKGEYIGLVDSDDFVSPDYFEVAYAKALETGSDCILNELYSVLNTGEIIHEPMSIKETIDISGSQALIYSIDWRIHSLGIWNAKLFKSIKYNLHGYHGNEYTTHELFAECNKVSFSQKGKYYYRKHAESITSKISIKKFDFLLKHLMLRELLKRKNVYEETKFIIENKIFTSIKQFHYWFFYYKSCFTLEEKQYARNRLKKTFNEFDYSLLNELNANKNIYKRIFDKIVFSNYTIYYYTSLILSKKQYK